jgi:hypothetical protein
MTEAVRALILDGHRVEVGDLVLHDADMDMRHPNHELTGRTRHRAWGIV